MDVDFERGFTGLTGFLDGLGWGADAPADEVAELAAAAARDVHVVISRDHSLVAYWNGSHRLVGVRFAATLQESCRGYDREFFAGLRAARPEAFETGD